jgi:hypothetical protein
MQAIKIDSINQTVSQIEIEKDCLESIYQELNCEIFTCPLTLDNRDCLYVDDEALFAETYSGAFYFGDYPQPLFGNGLIIGTNIEGESESVASSLKMIKNKVKFLPETTGEYFLSHIKENNGFTINSL